MKQIRIKQMIEQNKKVVLKAALKEKRKEWLELKVSGDIIAMSQAFGLSVVTISKAVNKGSGSLKLLQQINDFYEQRKQVLEAAKQPSDN